jgi:hypothetical protein
VRETDDAVAKRFARLEAKALGALRRDL